MSRTLEEAEAYIVKLEEGARLLRARFGEEMDKEGHSFSQPAMNTIGEAFDRAVTGLGLMVTFDMRAADALADAVDVLVQRKEIDSRSPAADALLDYRHPPSTARSNRMAVLESWRASACKVIQNVLDNTDPRTHPHGLDALTLRTARTFLQGALDLAGPLPPIYGTGPHYCVLCTLSLSDPRTGEGAKIGAGDGTGEKYAHPSCFYKDRLHRLKEALRKMNDALDLGDLIYRVREREAEELPEGADSWHGPKVTAWSAGVETIRSFLVSEPTEAPAEAPAGVHFNHDLCECEHAPSTHENGIGKCSAKKDCDCTTFRPRIEGDRLDELRKAQP